MNPNINLSLFVKLNSNKLCKVLAITRVDFVNMATESFLNVLSALAERSRKVVYHIDSVLLAKNFVVKSSWLFVVVVGMLVWISAN